MGADEATSATTTTPIVRFRSQPVVQEYDSSWTFDVIKAQWYTEEDFYCIEKSCARTILFFRAVDEKFGTSYCLGPTKHKDETRHHHHQQTPAKRQKRRRANSPPPPVSLPANACLLGLEVSLMKGGARQSASTLCDRASTSRPV